MQNNGDVSYSYCQDDDFSKLKLQNFTTLVQSYNSNNSQLFPKQKFTEVFPNLIKFLTHEFGIYFKQDLLKLEDDVSPLSKEELIKTIMKDHLNELEAEINILASEEWEKLNTYYEGRTKIHILISLTCLLIDFRVLNLPDYDKNVLLWAMLFHDIAKHVTLNPDLKEEYEQRRYILSNLTMGSN